MTYNNEHKVKSYKFRLGDNDKYRKNHKRILGDPKPNKIKPNQAGKVIIWKEK